DAEVQARVGVHDGEIDAAITLPRLAPSTMKKWIPAWLIRQPVSAQVKVSGKLPRLDTVAEFSLGEAKVDVAGPVEIGEAIKAELDVRLHHVELHSLIEDAPHARIDASSKVNIYVRGEDYRVEFDGKSEPMTVEEVAVPAMHFDLIAVPDEVKGNVSLLEPGG